MCPHLEKACGYAARIIISGETLLHETRFGKVAIIIIIAKLGVCYYVIIILLYRS